MGFDPAMLWRMLVSGGIGVGLFVLVLALSIKDHSRFRTNWRTGIVVGFAWFLLRLPAHVFVASQARGQMALMQARLPDVDPEVLTAMVYLAVVVSFTVTVLGILWYMLAYHAAADQWEALRPGPFPLLQRTGRTPWRVLGGAAASGVVVGGLATVAFRLFAAAPLQVVAQYEALGESTGSPAPYLLLPIAALTVTAAALSEELLFRGVLYGWLLRLVKGRRAGVALAGVLASLVLAAAYSTGAGASPAGCAYVFVTGLVFCEFARRVCLEAAIAAHVGLNLAALLVGLAIR